MDGLPDGSHYHIDILTVEKLLALAAAKAKEWGQKPSEDRNRAV